MERDDKKVAEMKMEIADLMRKRDYYDLLGLSRAAKDEDIKKAYKRLALRYHPDKNNVEGAKEVFKKVANAYSVLIDADKRANYDRFGPEEEQQRVQARAHARRAQQDHEFQFQDADQIFRAFFGGAHFHQPNQGHPFGQNNFFQQGHPAQQQRQGSILYVIGFLLVISFISSFFENKPYFSMTPSSQYRLKAETDVLKVTFFVNDQFLNAASRDPYFKKKIFQRVDYEYVQELANQCELAKKNKRIYESKAQRYGAGATRDSLLQKARQIDASGCDRLVFLRSRYQQYINRLYY